ncbi:high affinity copper uptake protein 1-like [Ptychodera flava]|uniref:high affinity copper uptake protein 1-like n=1 Tax=Ptychodera flava TaxID=63121 RepID=UPI00396A81F6
MNHDHHGMMMGTEPPATTGMAMNHGDHNMMTNGMTHDMMTHGMHDMSGTGGGHAGHSTGAGHEMKMYFHFSQTVTILFYEWQVDTVGALVGSCIAIFFLAMLYEGLKVLRESLLRKSIVNVRYSSTPVGKGSGETVLMETHGHGRARMFSTSHVIQTLLHIIQITLSYFLMLIFMTYNVWLCIAVALGAGVGYFIFGWKKTVVVDINEHCH